MVSMGDGMGKEARASLIANQGKGPALAVVVEDKKQGVELVIINPFIKDQQPAIVNRVNISTPGVPKAKL